MPGLPRSTRPWIPALGIGFHLAMDGLSLLLVLLTVFLGMAAVLASWTEIERDVGFFHFNLMATLTGIIGVFIAMDLFLFYFFWELMLVPMYFLIALWGHERRRYAAMKFFLFTQLSGLAMLAAILGLFFIHGSETGIYTFDYLQLLGTPVPPNAARLILAGFLAAFLVKLPAVPFHTWLPDAHTEAPTAGSVILAGLLLKTGAYGIIRFAVPLLPGAATEFAPVAMAIAVIGILYGALLAFAQTDIKRLVAYTSVSHMGFVLLGIFAWNEVALQGAVIQMLCHGVGTGALFILCGALQERIDTRDTQRMGGLWDASPRMGAIWIFFALAALGLPGMGNFVGEFLVLLGTYRVSVPMTVLAATGPCRLDDLRRLDGTEDFLRNECAGVAHPRSLRPGDGAACRPDGRHPLDRALPPALPGHGTRESRGPSGKSAGCPPSHCQGQTRSGWPGRRRP